MASVAQIIHERQSEIIARWSEQARTAASARGLDELALENLMPRFLSALADHFETGQLDANARRHTHIQTHLSSRIRQGFDLIEILDEFVLIGRCIADVWQSLPEDEWPSAADIERLHLEIHVAITDVTDTFYRHMLEDEQAEKRYLRRLQRIASEALRDETMPLRERVRELLDVVMDAMNARCAAYLVYNIRQATLELVASTGDPILEPYATSMDPKSFVAQIAANESPTPLYDVTSTRLEVPESLRHGGVHSLLGVRLPPRDSLLGVMYIGIAEAREFGARETRRIESLAERLGLHLENARLFAELHDTIESLHAEESLREQFVSTLAHDLRGPLSAARLASELLAQQPAGLDERRDLAVRIEYNIERVDRMIRDLLDASRIRAGERLPLRLDRCDLVALVHRIAEEARVMYGDRFTVEADAALVGVWSEDDLHRSLWNLVDNAVKYGASKQPIALAVAVHGEHARISIHNKGTPIPVAEQAHIFEPYARSSSASRSNLSGWGLGLTLVRGVAEAHGGRVTLVSGADGTTFTIDLPLDARSARSPVSRSAAIH